MTRAYRRKAIRGNIKDLLISIQINLVFKYLILNKSRLVFMNLVAKMS